MLSSTKKILGGFGNLEDYLLDFGRNPTAPDTPVVGRFADHVGLFFADDRLNGQPIRVRFTWNALAGAYPRWEQAFSNDGGETWEPNREMEFVPAR